MPVKPCREKGKPGFKWGDSGKCYVYTAGDITGKNRAKASAERQGRAVNANERTQ